MFDWIDDPYEMTKEEDFDYRMRLMDYEAEKRGYTKKEEEDAEEDC